RRHLERVMRMSRSGRGLTRVLQKQIDARTAPEAHGDVMRAFAAVGRWGASESPECLVVDAHHESSAEQVAIELARELQVVHGDGDVIEAAQAGPPQARQPPAHTNG